MKSKFKMLGLIIQWWHVIIAAETKLKTLDIIQTANFMET